MAELSLKPTLTIVKAPKTESDVDKYLLKSGRCPSCKMQTHERRGGMFNRMLVPLTNDQVLGGRCLLCHPIGGDSKQAANHSNRQNESSGVRRPAEDSLMSKPQINFLWNDDVALDESFWHETHLENYKQQYSEVKSNIKERNGGAEPEIVLTAPNAGLSGPPWHPQLEKNTSTDHRPSSNANGIPDWLNIDPLASTSLTHSNQPLSSSQSSPPNSQEPTIYVPQVVAPANNDSLCDMHVPEISFDTSKPGPLKTTNRRYSDGCYEGSMSGGGMRSGYGVMTYDNGDEHRGEWKMDVRSGRGTFTDAEGNVAEGTWENDRMQGYGVFRLVNGCEYAGEIKDGSWSGQGTYKSAEGDRYAGPFKDGEFDGPLGTMRYVNGNSYTGDWVCGIRDGKGVFKWSDGEVDLSAYAGHDREGQGVRFSSDGKVAWELIDGNLTHDITIEDARKIASRLDLEVPKNVPNSLSQSSNIQPNPSEDADSRPKGYSHPYLRRRFENKDEPSITASDKNETPSSIKEKTFAAGNYRGHLNQSGQREGQGAMNYAISGAHYVGSWKADMRNGNGTCRWPDGTVYVGEWIDDEMNGHGKQTYQNGDSYEGDFCASARHGRGIYKSTDGFTSIMCYNENIPVGRGARCSSDGTKTFSLKDGRINEKISLEEAEHIATNLGLSFPKEMNSEPTTDPDKSARQSFGSSSISAQGANLLLDNQSETNSFSASEKNSRKGARQTKKFRMGMYEGELNAQGEREGHGTMRYNSGARFDGQWVANKKKLGFNRSSGGNIYVGEFRSHQKFGEGVEWSANRTKVWRVLDGLKQEEVSTDKAQVILEHLGLDMPNKQ